MATIREIESVAMLHEEPAPLPELGNILIIEDDPRMQKVLRRMFVEENYSVFVAGDGGGTLSETTAPAAQPPNVVPAIAPSANTKNMPFMIASPPCEMMRGSWLT